MTITLRAKRSQTSGNDTIKGNSVMCGRNDRCVCGSGRKFKKCHGKVRNVLLNGLRCPVQDVTVDYDGLCRAAGFDPLHNPTVTVKVNGKKFTLPKGKAIALVDGLVIEVKR